MQVCLNSCPGREGLSQVSGWLMAGRLASVELFCCRLDQDSPAGSERLLIHSLAPDTFRSVTTICRRRIKTEEKAKDDQDNLKKGIEFILFFISSWCNSSYSSNLPVKNSYRGKEMNRFCYILYFEKRSRTNCYIGSRSMILRGVSYFDTTI